MPCCKFDLGEMKLAPGTYNYNFQCMLPHGLPTSVEHDVGHIAYGANVILNIPLWMDKEFKEHFTVIKTINLNADRTFRVIYTDFSRINRFFQTNHFSLIN